MTMFLTREAGTDQWDCTVYLGRYQEVVQLWTRQADATLSAKYYGLKAKDRVVRWSRHRLRSGVGGTDLLKAGLLALRESIATEESTERPEMDPLW